MKQRDTISERREEALMLELFADLTELEGELLLEENQRLSREAARLPTADDACKRSIRRYFFRKRALSAARRLAACLLALLVLGGTCLTVNASLEIPIRYWSLVLPGKARYQFVMETADTELDDYTLTRLPKGYVCTVENRNDSNHLKIYEGDGPMLMLEYCQMIQQESFAVTSPARDGATRQCTVEINGCHGTCYVSGSGSRPTRVVWLDYERRVAFILTGLFSSEDLIKLAESVSAVK